MNPLKSNVVSNGFHVSIHLLKVPCTSQAALRETTIYASRCVRNAAAALPRNRATDSAPSSCASFKTSNHRLSSVPRTETGRTNESASTASDSQSKEGKGQLSSWEMVSIEVT